MWEAGQTVQVRQAFGEAQNLLPPMKLIELQKDGSNGWQQWLVETQGGKKAVRWVTPGSVLVCAAPTAAKAPDDAVLFNSETAPRVATGNGIPRAAAGIREARKAHQPQLPAGHEALVQLLVDLRKQVEELTCRLEDLQMQADKSTKLVAEVHEAACWSGK